MIWPKIIVTNCQTLNNEDGLVICLTFCDGSPTISAQCNGAENVTCGASQAQ